MQSIDEDVRKSELSYIIDRNVNWYNLFGVKFNNI